MELSVRIERWPLAGAFTISRGSKTEAVVAVAELSDGSHSGRGECVPYARYGESVDAANEGLDPSPAFSIWPCASLAQLDRVSQARELLVRVVDAVRAEWTGPTPGDDRLVYRWLLHMFPIAVKADWERLRQSLAAAGGLVDREHFGKW